MDMVHVAYKGSAAFANDVIGGQIPVAIDTVADLCEMHKAGRVRILATSARDARRVTPDVPTLTELGFRISRPAAGSDSRDVDTPPATVQALNRHLNLALRSPDVVASCAAWAWSRRRARRMSSSSRLAADYVRWGRW